MRARAASVVLVFVSTAGLAAGERTGRDGDPLPEGAVARFGPARLLHGGVGHLELSPDGKILASAGRLGVRLWDVGTGKLLPAAHLPRWEPAAFAFTPDGGHLVGDADGCRLIDPRTGKVVRSWRNGDRVPNVLVVSADGKTAAVSWLKGGITVHELKAEGRDWKISDDQSDHLSLSGDGSRFAYARMQGDTSILLWETRTGKLLHRYVPEPSPVHAIRLSRDGRRLAASTRTLVRLWDTASHAPVEGFVPPEAEAVFLRFEAGDAELVGLSREKRLWRWSAADGKELAASHAPQRPTSPYWVITLSPDGHTVAALDHSALRLWDAASWKDRVAVERQPAWREAVFVRPDVVATVSYGPPPVVVAFWEVATGRPLRRHTLPVPKDEDWRWVLSPDGTLLAAGSGRLVIVFDVASGKEVCRIDPPGRRDRGGEFAFAPDGKTLVTTPPPDRLCLWDTTTGKKRRLLEGVADGAVAFSPDGRLVGSALTDRFELTEVASGKVRFRMPLPYEELGRGGEGQLVRHVRFAADSRSVVVASEWHLHVFSTVTGEPLLRLDEGKTSRRWEESAAGLSPDGRWLAHGDDGHAVCVRDLKNPRADREGQTLYGHAGHVLGVTFSPDGKYLVSCGHDGTALVWDARQLTGKPAPPRKPRPFAPEIGPLETPGAEVYWPALADADAGRAGRAMAALVALSDGAVPLLRSRLKPVPPASARQIAAWVAGLDAPDFAVRERAYRELEAAADQAVPALRAALAGKPSAELARQARRLLEMATDSSGAPRRLRQLRAVEVLERIGTPEARKVLETLATGAEAARLTRDARDSLRRWRAAK